VNAAKKQAEPPRLVGSFDLGGGTSWEQFRDAEREKRIQAAGQAAIVHHFACPRRRSLRYALVPEAINYWCDECGARVSVGPDGTQVAAEPPAPIATAPPAPIPGGLTWDMIEDAYRRLATSDPLAKYRRRRKDQPSRPETASALNVSPATLKRACGALGKGTHWPPPGV
jgi:hypothetical protein